MKLKEIATRDIAVVQPGDTLFEAARKMRAHDTGVLPVCEKSRVIGVVTDRDLAIRAIALGLDARTDKVRQVMTQEMILCSEKDEVSDAVAQMMERRVRRVIVVDRNQRPSGMVSLRDLALVPGGEAIVGQFYARLAEQPAGH
jgi:CBS domain-containing protein